MRRAFLAIAVLAAMVVLSSGCTKKIDDPGERGYQRCVRCHKADGAGGGAGPPLEKAFLSTPRLARIVLRGVKKTGAGSGDYHAMPGFAQIDDGELASVVTYVQRRWGGGTAAVTAAEVAAIRAATKGQKGAFVGADLPKD